MWLFFPLLARPSTETIIRNNQEAEIAWHYDHNILWPAGLFLAVTGNFKIHETASQHRAGVFWWEMIDSSLVPGLVCYNSQLTRWLI